MKSVIRRSEDIADMVGTKQTIREDDMKIGKLRSAAAAGLLVATIGAVNTATAEGEMTDLTTNPLGIAALESLDLAMNQRDIDGAMAYLSEPYIQHNPKAPSGLAAARAGMAMLAEAFPERQVLFKRVIVEGNMVVVHSHYIDRPGELGQAVVDIFRFEDGLIVEHWDVHEDVPATAANDNTMF